MTLTVTHAQLAETALVPGAQFTLKVHFAAPYPELATLEGAGADLFRIEKARNQFAFGFGANAEVVDNTLTISQKLPEDLPVGLYVVGAVKLNLPKFNHQAVPFPRIFFQVHGHQEQALSSKALAAKIQQLSAEREAHAHKQIQTPKVEAGQQGRPFRVLIFGVGCLLHAPQPLEGFVIVPLRKGFSYGNMLRIVNNGLWQLGIKQFDLDPQVEMQHEQATPTFLIEYWKVLGVDHADALDHCRRHADLMFDLLGFERGQKPREFFCMALEFEGPHRWHLFSFPGYRGNLVSDFNPVATANLIETVTPKLQSNPFLRLLVRSYAEATAEEDLGIALLRAWTVLELLADREIPEGLQITRLDGTPILRPNGKPRDTGAKEARVYEFIKRSGAGFPSSMSWDVLGTPHHMLLGGNAQNPNYTPTTRLLDLWELVRATYSIRNCVAHQGDFSVEAIDQANPDQVLAADLIKTTPLDPRRWVQDQAALAVARELHKP